MSSSVEMMETSDPGEKGTVSDEMSSSSSSSSKKSCADCHTTKTPLWRGGPAGPKSLCNACGIRYRKKRRAILGMNKGGKAEGKKRQNRDDSKFGLSSMKMRLLSLGKEVLLQRSAMEKQRKLGKEEEQAAILLMALSCGSVMLEEAINQL